MKGRRGGRDGNRGGRKPKPQLRLIQGGLSKVESSVPVQIAEVPDGLPKAGQQFWAALAPELEAVGMLSMLTMPAFYMTCLSWGLACDAAAAIEREGFVVAGSNGQDKKHPAVTVLNEQMGHFRQYLSEFGLSPAALKRLGASFEQDDDEMTRLLRGR